MCYLLRIFNKKTPIRVVNNSVANLTITEDHPIGWFYKDGILMDPNNIERSFKKCFRDNDRDCKAG